MFLMFARFSFKSSDLVAEDQNYLEHHVRLARQLPGVRMYLTGKLIETPHTKPDHYRAVVFGYDNPEAGLNSLDCPVGVELMADSAGHIVGTVVNAFQGDVIVPFDSRQAGQPCCVAALMYNRTASGDEARYRAYQNSIRSLPALCGYMAGPTFEARGQKPDRDWMEIRIFDKSEPLRQSFSQSDPLGASLLTAPIVHCLEGEVQI